MGNSKTRNSGACPTSWEPSGGCTRPAWNRIPGDAPGKSGRRIPFLLGLKSGVYFRNEGFKRVAVADEFEFTSSDEPREPGSIPRRRAMERLRPDGVARERNCGDRRIPGRRLGSDVRTGVPLVVDCVEMLRLGVHIRPIGVLVFGWFPQGLKGSTEIARKSQQAPRC